MMKQLRSQRLERNLVVDAGHRQLSDRLQPLDSTARDGGCLVRYRREQLVIQVGAGGATRAQLERELGTERGSEHSPFVYEVHAIMLARSCCDTTRAAAG